MGGGEGGGANLSECKTLHLFPYTALPPDIHSCFKMIKRYLIVSEMLPDALGT